MVTKVTKMNSPWFSKKNYYANVLAKLQKYQNLKALVYFWWRVLATARQYLQKQKYS